MTENTSESGAVLLDESFNNPRFDSRLRWLNPPPAVEVHDGWLSVTPGDKTDFWQKTVTGESHDNGHLLYLELSGDFVAETKVSGEFQNRYDHAGLMVHQDATHWLKTSAENDPVGAPHLGVVITRQTSDWSVSRPAPEEYTLRLTRRGDMVEVHTTLEGGEWALLRQAVLPLKDPVKVGIFAACPVREGFRVRFDYLRITRPPQANAHAVKATLSIDVFDWNDSACSFSTSPHRLPRGLRGFRRAGERSRRRCFCQMEIGQEPEGQGPTDVGPNRRSAGGFRPRGRVRWIPG